MWCPEINCFTYWTVTYLPLLRYCWHSEMWQLTTEILGPRQWGRSTLSVGNTNNVHRHSWQRPSAAETGCSRHRHIIVRDRQTERQTDRHRDRDRLQQTQTYNRDRHTHRQTDRHTHTDRQTHNSQRQTDGQTDTQTNRQAHNSPVSYTHLTLPTNREV